jgi:hypothetical protein
MYDIDLKSRTYTEEPSASELGEAKSGEPQSYTEKKQILSVQLCVSSVNLCVSS